MDQLEFDLGITEQIELDLNVPEEPSKLDKNPMVRQYGYGPENKRCKHCTHLFAKRYAGSYYNVIYAKIQTGPGRIIESIGNAAVSLVKDRTKLCTKKSG